MKANALRFRLQEGADVGILRAAPFKTLNVGLLALGIANWAVLLPWWMHNQEGADLPLLTA